MPGGPRPTAEGGRVWREVTGETLAQWKGKRKAETVLDEVREAQRVQGLLGQVRHDIGVMAESFVSLVSLVAFVVSMVMGLRAVVGNRGVLQTLQR